MSIALCRRSVLLFKWTCSCNSIQSSGPEINKYNMIFSKKVLNHLCKIATVFVPAMDMLVLIIQVYSEGSGEPAHLLSLITAFAIHLHRVWN